MSVRSPTSHKGENGSVAIIGGSRFQHGAPIFSALAAEASGVDLIFLFVSAMHAAVARNFSLNFQVHTFGSETNDEISSTDRTMMVEFLATMDSVVIGPGLSRSPSNLRSVMTLLEECPCPVVADASALQKETLAVLKGKHAVVTPHLGELERMQLTPKEALTAGKKSLCTFLIKGPEDQVIAEDGTLKTVTGGNAGLTVGGTGDALAGLTAGLIAQGHTPEDACVFASRTVKKAGEILYEEKGFGYTTREVIGMIPEVLKEMVA